MVEGKETTGRPRDFYIGQIKFEMQKLKHSRNLKKWPIRTVN